MKLQDYFVIGIAIILCIFFYVKAAKEEEWSDKSERMSNKVTREIADKLYSEKKWIL